MGLVLDMLTLPMLGAPRLVCWLAAALAEEVERGQLDEGRVRGQLLELQERYEAGEIAEDEYQRQEQALLELLKTIRRIKAQRTQRR